MLSGRRAFHGDSSVETLNAILKEEPPEFPEEPRIPPALDRLVRHCLEKKPGDRFQSARDLVYELEGLSGSAVATGKAVPADAARSRRRWLIAGLAGVLAVAALAGAFLAGRRTAPSNIPIYRQITFRRGLATSGRFTPDGKTVVYAASWDDAPAPEIYSVRTDAPESKSLGFPPGQVVGISSKSELAMLLPQTMVSQITLYPRAPGTLARVPLSGGTPRPVAEGVICADWAPDGERLAALRLVNGANQVEFPLGTVLARETPTDQPLTCPRVSPRGERLAFGTPEGYRVFETASGRSFSINGVPEWGHGTWWSWSPNGEEIWFPLEGGEPHEVPGLEPGLFPLRLSEDEASLLVRAPRATRTTPFRVERVDLATGRRTLVHEIRPADMAGVWLLLSPLLTPDGRGYAYSYFQMFHNLYLADGFR